MHWVRFHPRLRVEFIFIGSAHDGMGVRQFMAMLASEIERESKFVEMIAIGVSHVTAFGFIDTVMHRRTQRYLRVNVCTLRLRAREMWYLCVIGMMGILGGRWKNEKILILVDFL